MDVALAVGLLQPARDDGDQQGGGAEAHHGGRDGDEATAVRVGRQVPVAHRQESDGRQPHGLPEAGVLRHAGVVQLARAHRPHGHGVHSQDDGRDHLRWVLVEGGLGCKGRITSQQYQ